MKRGTALGTLQIAILRSTTPPGTACACVPPCQYLAALKLHERGLLDRNLGRGKSRHFIGNAAGQRFIQEHDGVLARAA